MPRGRVRVEAVGGCSFLLFLFVVVPGCLGEPLEVGLERESEREGECDPAVLDCASTTELRLGEPVAGRLGASGAIVRYRVAIQAEDTLIVELRGGSGKDFDLYVRKGEPPTLSVQDDWAHSATADETLTVERASPGDYYLMVRSFSGSGDYTLVAYLASTMPDSDGDGLWDDVEVELGLDPMSDQYQGEAEVLPWSGYWWPYDDGGISGPMATYDRYMLAAHGVDPGAERWEVSQHGDPSADYWVGHCHAWSAAALLEAEPVAPVTRAGVTFTVGDLKGLLTELHFADPVEFSIGVASPRSFHLNLLTNLGTRRRAVVADVAPTNETWNHPLYRYSITTTADADVANVRHYVATLTFLSDGVSPDFVGRLEMTRTYRYRLSFRNGGIAGGQWEGESVADHPDFFWRPASQRTAYGNPLAAAVLRDEIIGVQ